MGTWEMMKLSWKGTPVSQVISANDERTRRKPIKFRRTNSELRVCVLALIALVSTIPAAEAISRSMPVAVDSSTTNTLMGSSTISNDQNLLTSTSAVTPINRISSNAKLTMPSSSPGSSPGSPGTSPSIKVATVTPIPSVQGKHEILGTMLQNTGGADDTGILRQRMPPGLVPFDDEDEDDSRRQNETRERDALQEEGSHHQPVVFIGGPGYIPPSNLRPRPPLDAEIPWGGRPDLSGSGSGLSGTGGGPTPNTRFPYPLQTAWDRNYRNPFNMTRVQHIEAECQDDFMKLRVSFNGSFQGLIYSSGFAYDNDCVYVNGTGRDYYEYLIRLNRCGTLGATNHVEGRKEPSKNFMWNTVTVQYNPMIEEEWDEHFKVTCEYGYDFWKTVTFKPFDVEVATGNPVLFTLSPPECYMEVRYGFGASGTRVGGPVRVGDPLTLMIYMRSQFDGFDLVVNDCYAHNGGTKRIQLIDHYGCPVDSKLMSPFRGTWSHTKSTYETQVFAYLKTFRFTGSPALYIECDVRMCHGQCPSQPCYWRNVKNIQKRSISDEDEKNSTMSESINLSQALTVLQDQDEDSTAKQTESPDSVCLKTSIFTALFGLGSILLASLGMVSLIACFRLRRSKDLNDESSDIIRPYSHHTSTTNQQQPHQNRHWTTPNSLAKTRVP